MYKKLEVYDFSTKEFHAFGSSFVGWLVDGATLDMLEESNNGL